MHSDLALEDVVVAQIFGFLVGSRSDHHDNGARYEVREFVPDPGRHMEGAGRVVEGRGFLDHAVVEMNATATARGDEDQLGLAMTVTPAPLARRHVMQPEHAHGLEVEALAGLEEIDAAARIGGAG